MEYTDEQKAIALHIDSPALVVAGAGSGKTETVTLHVRALAARGVRPNNIMMMTFTRKAAEEMRERIRDKAGDDVADSIVAGTFHSIGTRMLRSYGWKPAPDQAPTADFDVLGAGEAADSLDLLKTRFDKRWCEHAHITEKELGKHVRQTSDALASFISKCTNMGLSVREGLDVLEVPEKWDVEYLRDYLPLLETAWRNERRNRHQLTYDDILEAWAERLQTFPQMVEHVQALVIDEAQDMNDSQHEIVRLIYDRMATNHLMLVGDAAQSIYGWRGSDVHAFDEFPENYDDAKVYELSCNFRSYAPVLDMANDVLEGMDVQSTTRLWSKRGRGPKVHNRICSTQMAQASEIARLAKGASEDRRVCILARSSSSFPLIEMRLREQESRYRVCGGTPFAERKDVRDIMALLRFAYDKMNEESLCRLLKLFDNIGNMSAREILASPTDTCLEENALIRKKTQRAVAAKVACDTLRNCRTILRQKPWPEAMDTTIALYRKILVDTEDRACARQMANDRKFDAAKRDASFQEAVLDPLDYQTGPMLRELAALSNTAQGFADDFKLETPTTKEEDQSWVTLSTIHSAKGLEWETVIIADCSDESFSSRSQDPRWKAEEQEEQRRCLYVAVTRARDDLYVMRPKFAGLRTKQPTHESRYLRSALRRCEYRFIH